MEFSNRYESRFTAAAERIVAERRKRREPEKLLSVKQAQQLYLNSYSKTEIYRMLKTGELRALWQLRGNRRHWSIPLSAITDFINQLHSNRDTF